MENSIKITVISGGLGTPSSTHMLAKNISTSVIEEFSNQGLIVNLSTIELRQHATDIAHNMVTGFAPPELAVVMEQIRKTDALIVVSPVFSGSYSGLFKSFFDVLDPELLSGTPVIIAATGGSTRHSLMLEHAMRPLFTYLKAQVMPTSLYASPEDWAMASGEESLNSRINRAAIEMVEQFNGGIRISKWQEPKESVAIQSLPFAELLSQLQR